MRSVGENRDELPNCFLERRRLGCPLPCAIRLRTQRSDHMAVGSSGASEISACFRERRSDLTRCPLDTRKRTSVERVGILVVARVEKAELTGRTEARLEPMNADVPFS